MGDILMVKRHEVLQSLVTYCYVPLQRHTRGALAPNGHQGFCRSDRLSSVSRVVIFLYAVDIVHFQCNTVGDSGLLCRLMS